MKIAHLSDLHIRSYSRHDEYKESFKHLYTSLRAEKPDIIVFAGDFVHQKTVISPELVKMCADHLKELSSIAPLHMIFGNHDGNLDNLSKLDAISPIADALNSPNIFYYKNSGVYGLSYNFNLVVYSCFDPEEAWPKGYEINEDAVNIGLFHGMVSEALIQSNIPVFDCPHSAEKFLQQVDYLLLGDIHHMQFTDPLKRSAYCGSYPQQNYAEVINKGYLVWDIQAKDKHEVRFVELPNVCPFYTVELNDTLDVPSDLNLSKNARIRIISRQLTHFEKKDIKDKVISLYSPYKIDFLDDKNASLQEVKINNFGAKIENLRDLSFQERLIREYLAPLGLQESTIQRVIELNTNVDIAVRREEDILRNVNYTFGKFEFGNLFSYGEKNEFDFRKYKGTVGIFGKSAVGKSSLVVDIPLLCISNRVSKNVVKNDQIINENFKEGFVRGEIFVGDRDRYVIERKIGMYIKSGKKSGNPVYQGRTDVDFAHYQDGVKIDKNGEQRSDTDNSIRHIFGTAEDFIATSVAPQWQLTNFIDAGSTERQSLIGRYFDVDVFEKKSKYANEDFKKIKGELKFFEDMNFEEEKKKAEEGLALKNKEIALAKETIQRLEEVIGQNTKIRDDLRTKLSYHQVKETKEELEKKIKKLQKKEESLKENIEKMTREKKEVKVRMKSLVVSGVDVEKLREERDNLEARLKSFDAISKDRHFKEISVNASTMKIEKLKKYPCVSNENCCMGKQIEEESCNLSKLKTELHSLATQKGILEERIAASRYATTKEIDKVIDDHTKSVISYTNLESKLYKLEADIWGFDADLKSLQEEIYGLKDQVEKLSQNENNGKIFEEIKEIEKGISFEENMLKEANRTLLDCTRSIGFLEAGLRNTLELEKKYINLKQQFDAYEFFMQAMSKDGIPKRIISDNLNIINSEIAKILSSGVEFGIELVSEEGGKNIEVYFSHQKSKKRRIEICSGMEKSIASIAIRAALVNITTLPKSNIFVLDEAFSYLDSEYVDAVSRMIDYLKQLFDTIIVITHLDQFKDMVDYIVEIDRDSKGFARINC